jgi:hypothetical protein
MIGLELLFGRESGEGLDFYYILKQGQVETILDVNLGGK